MEQFINTDEVIKMAKIMVKSTNPALELVKISYSDTEMALIGEFNDGIIVDILDSDSEKGVMEKVGRLTPAQIAGMMIMAYKQKLKEEKFPITNQTVKLALEGYGYKVDKVESDYVKDGFFYTAFITIDGVKYETSLDNREEVIHKSLETGDFYVIKSAIFGYIRDKNKGVTTLFGGPKAGKQRDLLGKIVDSDNIKGLITEIKVDFFDSRGRIYLKFITNVGEVIDWSKIYDSEIEAIEAGLDNGRAHRGIVSRVTNGLIGKMSEHCSMASSKVHRQQETPVVEEVKPQMDTSDFIKLATAHIEMETEKQELVKIKHELVDGAWDNAIHKAKEKVNQEERERLDFTPLATNTLLSKIYKAAGDYDFESLPLSLDVSLDKKHIVLLMGDAIIEFAEIKEGMNVSEWAMDGRKNWRAIKRLVEKLWNFNVFTGMVEEEEEYVEPVKTEWDLKMEELLKRMEEWKEKWDNYDWNQFHYSPHTAEKKRLMEIIGAESDDDMKRCYRTWMKANHPDTNPNSDLSLVQEVNDLMDKVRKSSK